MKLLKLELENFLSWKKGTIQFADIQGACLVTGSWEGGSDDKSNGCISGDTVINYNRATIGRKETIRSMYASAIGTRKHSKGWDKNVKTYVRSWKGDVVGLNEIEEVVDSGIKKVFRLRLENGLEIKATGDHLIMTDCGYVPLCQLSFSHRVMCDTLKPIKNRRRCVRVHDKIIGGLKYHPFSKNVIKKIEYHRALWEAYTNEFPLMEYVNILRTNKTKARLLKYVNIKTHCMHHKDFDHFNNSIDNLQCLSYEEHRKIHNHSKNFGQGVPYFSYVESVVYVGRERTFDIRCVAPHHNFVANGIVVHNSGKSSLFEAIGWALFGESRARIDDELVNDKADVATVVLDFSMDETQYRITKSKRRGGSGKLWFDVISPNPKSYTGNSIKETQMKIVEEIGMDYALWVNTVWARQGELDNFPQRSPSERKEIFSKMLSIEKYMDWESKAKGLAETYRNDSQALEMVIQRTEESLVKEIVTEEQISNVEESLKEIEQQHKESKESVEPLRSEELEISGKLKLNDQVKDALDLATKKLERVEKQLSYQESELLKSVGKVDEEVSRFKRLVDTESQVQSLIAEVEGKVKGFDQMMLRTATLKEESFSIVREMEEANERVPRLEEEVGQLREKLVMVDGLESACPTCGSALDPSKVEKIKAEIIRAGKANNSILKRLKDRVKELEERQKVIKAETSQIGFSAGKQNEFERDLEKYRGRLLDIGIAKNGIAISAERKKSLKDDYDKVVVEIQKERDEIESHIKILKGQVVDRSEYESRWQEIAQKIREAELRCVSLMNQKSKLDSTLNILKTNKDLWEKKKIQLDVDKSKLQTIKENEFVYSELSKAFGKKGIPALIIDSALAEIQVEVRNRLDRLTDGRIKVLFSTERDTKDKDKKTETLDILVDDGSQVKDYRLYSGGEKVRISIAIRLALAKIISRRSGKQIRCIGIDEIPDLDGIGMRTFVSDIREVGKEYDQIFVVSHIQELKDQFAQRIHIVRDTNGSRIGGA